MSDTPCGQDALLTQLGRVDIYVFDQLLRGRITPEMRILDAGCGHGRNVHYLMRCGARVFGVDRSPEAVERVRALASRLAPELDPEHFQVGEVADLPFSDRHFDAVLSSAVLHFAEDEAAFEAMLVEMWRVLRNGGILFTRLASTIGIRDRVTHREGRRFHLPDGTERFLVDEPYLLGLTELLGGELLDPLKTTNVQNRRAMTTWVLRKTSSGTPSFDDDAARRLRAPELATLLERLESLLYRLPRWSGETPLPALRQASLWTRDDEETLGDGAAGYGEETRTLAGEVADSLAELRERVGRLSASTGADAATRAEERETYHALLDEAKATLSGLKTRVLVEDTLREDR